jgi:hypothetical protein
MVDIQLHEEMLQQYNLRVLDTQNVLVVQVSVERFGSS